MQDLSAFSDESFDFIMQFAGGFVDSVFPVWKDEFNRINASEGVCFGHSLSDIIQGQIDAGFLIAGFYKDSGFSMLDKYINTFFATKAVKSQ